MKKPIRAGTLKIQTGHRHGDNYWAKAGAMKATSTSSGKTAAVNLAVRWFFDGSTKAQGVGPKEYEAIELTSLGNGIYEASLSRAALMKYGSVFQIGTTKGVWA
jgi:hypothetical protein